MVCVALFCLHPSTILSLRHDTSCESFAAAYVRPPSHVGIRIGSYSFSSRPFDDDDDDDDDGTKRAEGAASHRSIS